MAYRFNNGRGGVTCDNCRILFDSDLSYAEYVDWYCHGNEKLANSDNDFCWKCKKGVDKDKRRDG